MRNESAIAIVGLGYVGLPLAVAFGSMRKTIGFDLNERKLAHYRDGRDPSGEVSPEQLRNASLLEYTSDPTRLAEAGVVIVVVPTPIDAARRPDLSPLEGACRTVGAHLQPGTIVVFESTVYPGCTEEVCVPILEQYSGLPWSGRGEVGAEKGFYVGYSPERINPGDKEHRLETIVKVVSGDTPETLETVAELYSEVVKAGVHRAASLKVAEAAKVIENTQRDLNIALMNELALIFGRLGIPTRDVLAAAGTKWNFLKFTPGLVGGHCIGVDPYYLTFKAESIGYHPQVILAGRRINDGMGKHVAEMTVKELIRADKAVKGARVLVLGLTFKENVPDIRNSKVIDIVRELAEYGIEVVIHDPVADPAEAAHEYGVTLTPLDAVQAVDAVVWAVAHQDFAALDFGRLGKLYREDAGGKVLIDVKAQLDPAAARNAGYYYWSL